MMVQELSPLVGTAYGGEELCIGADNTPTERIDRVAEDLVLSVFREKKICRSLLSEEAGMVDIGGGFWWGPPGSVGGGVYLGFWSSFFLVFLWVFAGENEGVGYG